MKKTLLALSVLGAFAGVASAATNVSLYGRVDVGVGHNNTTTHHNMSAGGYVGLQGEEDLGNGMAATFQLEGGLGGADEGTAKLAFDRVSTVGLKTPYGHFRLGRTWAAIDGNTGLADVGRRLASPGWYRSLSQHSNSLYYSHEMSGAGFGAHVSTKGGSKSNATEGAVGTSKAWGAHLSYTVAGVSLAGAYQRDRDPTGMDKEMAVAASYTFNPVTLAASYAKGTMTNTNKTKVLQVALSGNVTPNDVLAAIYHKRSEKDVAGVMQGGENYKAYGLEWVHSLSKRTSVYANVARVTPTGGESGTGWDLAIRHHF